MLKIGFNKIKGLLYIVFGTNVFNQLNYCFNRLISLMSSEIKQIV